MPHTNLATSFNSQYFVVTGSTQGLGAAVAHTLARRGAAGLIICGRRRIEGQEQVRQLAQLGCQAFFVEADLEKVEDCRAIIEAARTHFGTLHGLVNCAGMSDRGTILDTSPQLFERLFAVNVRAPFFLMQEALKLMISKGVEGAVVNIQSVTGHGGQSFLSAYAASKGALAILTKNVAFSALRNRIRVNGLNIGWMDTPHEDQIQRHYHGAQDGWLAEAEHAQPFGRLLKPEEVARSVAFLLSTESGMMSGAVIDLEQGVVGCTDSSTPQPHKALSLPGGA
ncbi:oxidoreductase, short chain dehydrogenase/reductase family [Pseudomonas synxantha BG33R]|uniref:SDR family oxidoreductase n=1 Tax=Pseudomonas TaxID=286 RepID=UPI00025FF81A|nr:MULTISPECIES: SDR family oxidoreductase [Pseudomonas]EIK69157.1 oxidoreductase, short chain dehydrogenase/reductase family [Pseudomonas synxantha BG33R]QOY73982.1 SDR family oxidoreductase [Pseudomonas sp. OST1909]WPN51621.1 SDR family oxidoreductase [Pseudomonas sp. P9_2]